MTARHSAVRVDPAEPCPFCGSGGTALGTIARPRRQTKRVRYQLTPVPLDLLPDWWQAIMRGLNAPPKVRPLTTAEVAYATKLDAGRGKRAVIDGDNNVRFEEDATAAD